MSSTIIRLKSVICYTGIASLLFLNSDDRFVRFHARQGFALLMTLMLSFMIPIIGWIIVGPYVFISALTASVKAWDYEKWKVPLINKFIHY